MTTVTSVKSPISIKRENEVLARAIGHWCIEHEMQDDVRIFFNGAVHEWLPSRKLWAKQPGLISNYCPYAADGTVGVVFKGHMYETLHNLSDTHPLVMSFNDVFVRHDLAYQMDHTWCLTSRPIELES